MSGIDRIEPWPSLSQSIVNTMSPPHEAHPPHPGHTEVSVPRAEAPAPVHFAGQSPEARAKTAAHHPPPRGSRLPRARHAAARPGAGVLAKRDPVTRVARLAFIGSVLALAIAVTVRNGLMGLYLAVLTAAFVAFGLWIDRAFRSR